MSSNSQTGSSGVIAAVIDEGAGIGGGSDGSGGGRGGDAVEVVKVKRRRVMGRTGRSAATQKEPNGKLERPVKCFFFL